MEENFSVHTFTRYKVYCWVSMFLKSFLIFVGVVGGFIFLSWAINYVYFTYGKVGLSIAGVCVLAVIIPVVIATTVYEDIYIKKFNNDPAFRNKVKELFK